MQAMFEALVLGFKIFAVVFGFIAGVGLSAALVYWTFLKIGV